MNDNAETPAPALNPWVPCARKFLLLVALLALGASPALAVTPSLSAGSQGLHSEALKADGSVWFWGYKFIYTGTRTIVYQSIATPTNYSTLYPLAANATAVAGGANVALTVGSNGALVGWGSTASQLINVTTPAAAPAQLTTGFTTVAAGFDHVLALKADHTLWSWGSNTVGQLGNNSVNATAIPVQVGTGFAAISAGYQFSVGLKQDGSLWAWGGNNSGQVGDGTAVQRNVPVQIGTGFTSIAAGGYHTLALKGDGSLWSWGYNSNGQLGNGTTALRNAPTQIAASGFAKIAAGENHSVAIKQDGTLFAWGYNVAGQVGDGTVVDRLSPVQIGTGYNLIAAGSSHTLAAKTDGALLAWGANDRNQLGDGTKTTSLVPLVIDAHFFQGDTTAPTAPTVAVTARTLNSVSLSLSGSTDDVGVSSYKFYRNGALIATQPLATLTDAGLSSGTSYNYTASACDAAGNCSPQSAAVSATTVSANAVPTAPTLTTSNLAMNSVNLTLSGATDDVAVTSYQIYRNASLIATQASNSYTDTGLVVVTSYSYTAKACDADANCSPLSNAVTVITPDTAAPTTPGVLNLTPTATTVQACWGTSTDNVAVTSHKLLRGSTVVATPAIGGDGCSTETGLTPSTSYGYQVVACDAAGNCSAPTIVVTTKTLAAPDTQAPSVPTGLRAVAVNVLSASPHPVVIVAGAAATDNVGVTGYRLYRGGVKVADSNRYLDSNVVANTSYSYTVDACDALANCSAQSAAVTVTTPGAPTVTPVAPPAGGTPLSYAWAASRAGWILAGNSLDSSMDMRSHFGDANLFTSVWKWDPSLSRWEFYAPALDAAGGTALADYAAAHGYAVLDTVYPGEGFWVSAKQATAPATRSGFAARLASDHLLKGWNLAATADDLSAANLATALGEVNTLWAWSDADSKWYFHAPQLAASGTLAGYVASHGYLDFDSLGLGKGRGFWINRAATTLPAGSVALPPAPGAKPVLSPEASSLSSVYVVNSGGEVLGAGAYVVSPANTRESAAAAGGFLSVETARQARQFMANEGFGGGPAELLLLKTDGTLLARGFNDASSIAPVNLYGSLGTGTASGVEVPNWTPVLSGIRSISRTATRSFAVGADDSLWVSPNEVTGSRSFSQIASNVNSYKTSSGGDIVLTRDGRLLIGGSFFHLPIPTDPTARAGMQLTNDAGQAYTYFQSHMQPATGYSRENLVQFASDVVAFDYADLGGNNGYFCYVSANGELYSNLEQATMQYPAGLPQVQKWTDIGDAKACAVAAGPSIAVLQRNGTLRFNYALNSGFTASGWKEAATNLVSFTFGGTTDWLDNEAPNNATEALITGIKSDGTLWTNHEHYTGLVMSRTHLIRKALSDVAGFEGHYAWKTDGTLWRLTTSTLQPNTGSYVQVPNVLVTP